MDALRESEGKVALHSTMGLRLGISPNRGSLAFVQTPFADEVVIGHYRYTHCK